MTVTGRLTDNGRLKVSIQKSGRMTEKTIELLNGSGFRFTYRGSTLYTLCTNYPADILAVRDDDIPRYVEDGVSQLGIVGLNIVQEEDADVEILKNLNFGRCRLSICVPNDSKVSSLSDLDSGKIATSYPNTLKKHLLENGLRCDIKEISGSTELAPSIGVSDAICELIATGSTLRVHGLRELSVLSDSEAVLIANKPSLDDEYFGDLIEQFLQRINSKILADGKKYLVMNAPAEAVEKIKSYIPGLKSPTVLPLLEEGMVAVHSVVDEQYFWDVLEDLKRAGASDIAVSPIDNLIP